MHNLGRTIGCVSTKRQKEYCNSFSLHKGSKAWWSLVFSESSTIVKCWDIFCENWEPRRRTALKLASTTQNCLENTTACILEYRTNVNGTVIRFFWVYWNNRKIFFTWLLMALQLIITCWQLPIRDNLFIKYLNWQWIWTWRNFADFSTCRLQ